MYHQKEIFCTIYISKPQNHLQTHSIFITYFFEILDRDNLRMCEDTLSQNGLHYTALFADSWKSFFISKDLVLLCNPIRQFVTKS